MSGFSIRAGFGDAKKIIANYPYPAQPLDDALYQAWLDEAEKICEEHNASLGF